MHVLIQIGYLDRNVELEEDEPTSVRLGGHAVDPARPREFLQSLVDRAAAAVQLPDEPPTPARSSLLAAAEQLDRLILFTEGSGGESAASDRNFFRDHPLGDRMSTVGALGNLTAHRARALFAEWLRTLAAEEAQA